MERINCLYEERMPSTVITDLIPQWVQKGLKNFALSLTCLDVIDEFYVFGSNIGIIYLVDRSNYCLRKLKCDVRPSHLMKNQCSNLSR